MFHIVYPSGILHPLFQWHTYWGFVCKNGPAYTHKKQNLYSCHLTQQRGPVSNPKLRCMFISSWCNFDIHKFYWKARTLKYDATTRGVNTLRPRGNYCHFADDIFKCIFVNENAWFSFKISMTFAPRVRIYSIPELVQIMVWRRPGDRPLSEPIMLSFLTYMCVTRPQWVKIIPSTQPVSSTSESSLSLS